MKENAVEVVALRNLFYRDNYRRTLILLLLLVLSNVLLVGVIFYLFSNKPAPVYFAVNQDGSLTKLYPLNEPVLSANEILSWANKAITDAFTFDFLNYQKQFQESAELFTTNGWKNFLAELQRTKTLDLVIKEKLTASASATGAPVIERKDVLDGRYTWKISMPVLVTYDSKNLKIPQPLKVILIIRRVSNLDRPMGVAIEAFNSVERTS